MKTKISEWSTTPSSNTDIDGINIAEGCAPSGINDAIRDLMAQVRSWQSGASGDPFNGPMNGTVGATTAYAGAFTTLSASSTVTLSGGTANGVTYLNGSKVLTSGSALTFDGTSLGVGIATPTFADGKGIHINNATGSARLHLTSQTSGSAATDGSEFTVAGSDLYIINNESAATIFYNAGSEQMRLTSTGLGIGTSSPANKLHVVGTSYINVGAYASGYALTLGASSETSRTYQIGMVTGGNLAIYDSGASATRLTLDSSGNLGLGVTPSAWNSAFKALQVGQTGSIGNNGQTVRYGNNFYYDAGGSFRYIATSYAMMMQLDAGSGGIQFYTAPSGTAGNAITFTQAMTLDASGNLGVGTTSPVALNSGGGYATFNNASGGGSVYQYGGSNIGYVIGNTDGLRLDTFTGKILKFGIEGSERARIDSSGRLFIAGTTSSNIGGQAQNLLVYSSGTNTIGAYQTASGGYCYNSYAVSNAGTYYHVYFSDAGTSHGSITSNGTITSYATTSDYRLKNSIAPMTGALAKVALLKPCTYKWNSNGSDGEGFIAHELAEVVPQAVVGEKDAVDEEGNPKYQGIDVSFLVATLTAAIQELKAEFDAYKASHP